MLAVSSVLNADLVLHNDSFANISGSAYEDYASPSQNGDRPKLKHEGSNGTANWSADITGDDGVVYDAYVVIRIYYTDPSEQGPDYDTTAPIYLTTKNTDFTFKLGDETFTWNYGAKPNIPGGEGRTITQSQGQIKIEMTKRYGSNDALEASLDVTTVATGEETGTRFGTQPIRFEVNVLAQPSDDQETPPDEGGIPPDNGGGNPDPPNGGGGTTPPDPPSDDGDDEVTPPAEVPETGIECLDLLIEEMKESYLGDFENLTISGDREYAIEIEFEMPVTEEKWSVHVSTKPDSDNMFYKELETVRLWGKAILKVVASFSFLMAVIRALRQSL
ncbi:hypothetical protein JD969_15110 [Planctomycetota bacterium]|nr:hypothetical protein JD969_15110 [Planctomycetota bacterium]